MLGKLSETILIGGDKTRGDKTKGDDVDGRERRALLERVKKQLKKIHKGGS